MKSDLPYLHHILDACNWIIELTVEGKETFLTDTKTQDSCIRKMEIIGEACTKVTASLRASHEEVPWSVIIGLRNRLIHDYLGVDLEIVWKTATDKIPEFKEQIVRIIEAEGE